MKEIMKSVNIINPEALEILEEMRSSWWDIRENLQDFYKLWGNNFNRDDMISDEYKNKIINQGRGHSGFPEAIKCYNLDPNIMNSMHNLNENVHKKYNEACNRFTSFLSAHRNSLGSVYPPGGYISWHNNANASAYNLIFTWSENGNGYWKHIDPNTNEEVIVKDVPGWQCKGFYFGSYEDDPKSLVYHMASTDCWRMTVAYVFDRSHKDHWEAVIEELETID